MIAVLRKAHKACFMDLDDLADDLLRTLSVGELGRFSTSTGLISGDSDLSGVTSGAGRYAPFEVGLPLATSAEVRAGVGSLYFGTRSKEE